MGITLKYEDTRRPCFADEKRALFHQWVTLYDVVAPSVMVGGHQGGQISEIFALCELEDGKTIMVPPSKIIFADGGDFGSYVWFPSEKEG